MRPLGDILDKHLHDLDRGFGYRIRANGQEGVKVFRIAGELWLTAREVEILKLIVKGLPNKAVATELSISVKTVEKHRASLNTKLGAQSALDLAKRSYELGIMEPPQVHPQFSGPVKPDSDGAAVSTPKVTETPSHNSPNGTTNPSSNGHTKQ